MAEKDAKKAKSGPGKFRPAGGKRNGVISNCCLLFVAGVTPGHFKNLKMKKALIFILFLAAFAGCKGQQWSEEQKQFWQREELKELERLDSLLMETRINRQ